MILLYVPFQSIDAAKTVAKILVDKKVAGKVDIMPTNSVSLTDSGVVESSGAAMVINTIDKHVQGVEDVVREYYQDGVPCIATISLFRLNRDFKDWLITTTS
jgi:uncharacterized protein involved in tolerance to divalent cations